MDVNRDNFYEILPEILGTIDEADFIAIDGEFTGILPFNKLNYFDTAGTRYERHFQVDRHYMMVQIGLTMIRSIDTAVNRYSMSSYNFYLFPENENDSFDFRCKTSSLQFLASNRFDFTQLFLKGIPFVCKTKHLSKLRANRRSQKKTEQNDSTSATFVSDEELLKESMTGFSTVIWKIQESGKPIIGHNMHMDIFHVVNQFFTPLPESHDEYRTIVQNLFPKLIDTKILASLPIFRNLIPNTALQAVYQSVRDSSFPSCDFAVAKDFKYAVSEHEHTAGYDATCTGVIFVKMIAFINKERQSDGDSNNRPSLESFYGKLFFMRSYDIQYVDFLIPDYLPDRSSVFYVKHPPSLTNSQLKDFCQMFNVRTYERTDPSTTIIGVSMKNETFESVLAKLRSNEKNFVIIPYCEQHTSTPNQGNRDILELRLPKKRAICEDPDQPKMDSVSASTSITEQNNIERNRTYNDVPAFGSKLNPTLEKLIEEKEKLLRQKTPKLFDYDDEW